MPRKAGSPARVFRALGWKGATDAWVTGTPADRAKTSALERHFSAASSGGDRRAALCGTANLR